MRTFIVIALVLCSSIVTLDAAEKTVIGTVKAVDAANNSITVDDVELDVTRKSQISVDGRKAGLEDVKTGQPARVTYEDFLEVAITIVIGKGSEDDEATAKDMKAIQGEWKCVASEENGRTHDKSIIKKQNRRVTVKGNSLAVQRVVGDKLGTYTGKFEINASNGSFDWVGKGPSGDFVEWIGIYELDGDELKLCFIYQKDDEAKRPTEFKSLPPSKPGMHHVFFTFKQDND